MAETIIAKLLVRQGSIQDLPMLAAGEFGLAQDEQRLFIGQTPKAGIVVSSDATVATVKFNNNFNDQADHHSIDLDNLYNRAYQIEVYDSVTLATIIIPGASVISNDGENTFDHGLSRVPTVNDTFTLRHNKEITTTTGDKVIAGVESIYLQPVTAPGTPEDVQGINFNSDVKNSITLDYILTLGTSIRKGTLSISVYGDTTSNIDDKFTSSADLANVQFSISTQGLLAKNFNLQYDTTTTEQIQFSYIQTSFKQNII